jgi:hypothetical protein
MSALQLAGLTIRAKNGSILLRPLDSGQGMAFGAWEVASMAKGRMNMEKQVSTVSLVVPPSVQLGIR